MATSEGRIRTLIIPVEVRGRSFRIHIGGPQRGLHRVLEQLNGLSVMAVDEDQFLATLAPILAAEDVILADVLDLSHGSSISPFLALFDGVARQKTADRAWFILRTLLDDARDADLRSLIEPSAQLVKSRAVIQSVLDDLDEGEDQARTELVDLLPTEIAYLLVL